MQLTIMVNDLYHLINWYLRNKNNNINILFSFVREEIIPLTLDIYNVRFWGTIYIIVSMYILSTTNKYYY